MSELAIKRRTRVLVALDPASPTPGVLQALTAAGIRAELDIRNEKISYKVREHSVTKVPVIMVVGKREADERTVAVRRLGGKAQDVKSLDSAVADLADEARSPLEWSAQERG